MSERARETSIEIYDDFKRGLETLLARDRDLFGKDIRKETLACRLAMYLAQIFPPEWFVDISVEGADLLVWDRNERIALALFISRDYVSEKGKEKARNFHSSRNCMLTLAFTLFSDEKDYILIYRFERLFLDYIHIFPSAGFEERVLKRCLSSEIDRNDDPMLFRIRRRHRKPASDGRTGK